MSPKLWNIEARTKAWRRIAPAAAAMNAPVLP